jgi:hypothetical protein
MKKRLGISLSGISLLVLILFISNPSQERHTWKLSTTTGIPTMEPSAMTTPPIKTSAMAYHNYFLFSTTTHRQTGSGLTLGILWMVFNLQAA